MQIKHTLRNSQSEAMSSSRPMLWRLKSGTGAILQDTPNITNWPRVSYKAERYSPNASMMSVWPWITWWLGRRLIRYGLDSSAIPTAAKWPSGLPALDNRIRASVSNCGCVSYKQSLVRDIGVQMEFCLPGVLQIGDVEDIVRLVSPRALLLQATSEDVWSRGATVIFEHAESAFPKGKLKLRCWPGGHVFTQEMREAAYRFLDEHLQRGNKPNGI